jgi:hypothetical protein
MAAPEEELEEGKMPLLDHLIELRQRIFYSLLALLVMFFPCYYFSQDIYGFLTRPLAQVAHLKGDQLQLIYTDLTEAFWTNLRIAFWGAFCLSFPVIASQLWMFVAPGLYKNERRAFLPYLLAAPLLFILGGAVVYFFIFPVLRDPRRTGYAAGPGDAEGERVPDAGDAPHPGVRRRFPTAGAAYALGASGAHHGAAAQGKAALRDRGRVHRRGDPDAA